MYVYSTCLFLCLLNCIDKFLMSAHDKPYIAISKTFLFKIDQ